MKAAKARIVEEPPRHDHVKSKLERVWEELHPGECLIPERVERFDAASNITHMPVVYNLHDVSGSVPSESPPDEWIEESFFSFVRGEFGQGTTSRPYVPVDYGGLKSAAASADIDMRYLERCEAELVFGGVLPAIHQRRGSDIVDTMYDIFCTDGLGNYVNRRFIEPSWFRDTLEPLIKTESRLQFVLLGFPFKDQNYFRTLSTADSPDLAESALMIRLHCLSMALYTVHPFGSDWIVLTDGRAYAPIFGVTSEHAERYSQRLMRVRRKLNLQGSLSVIDLADVAHHLDGTRHQGRFDAHREHIRARLTTVSQGGTTAASMKTLMRGMAWNHASRDLVVLDKATNHELWDSLMAVGDTERRATRLDSYLRDRAYQAALEYAAFNLALRWQDTVKRVFPLALRATVHAKPGQICVPSLGSVAPWNGVPLVANDPPAAGDISVRPLYDFLNRVDGLVRRIDDDGNTAYFTIG